MITEEGFFINNLEFKVYVKDYKFLYTLDSKIDLKLTLASISLEKVTLEIEEFKLQEFKCESTSKILRKVTRYVYVFIEELIN